MAFLHECDGISHKYMICVSIPIQVFRCGGHSLTLWPEYPSLAPDLKEVTSPIKPRMYCYTGVHKFFKNVDTTPKFKVPAWWCEASYILRTHDVGVTCEHQWCLVLCAGCMLVLHIFICEGKSCPKCAESVSCHCTEFGNLGEQHLNLCTSVRIGKEKMTCIYRRILFGL